MTKAGNHIKWIGSAVTNCTHNSSVTLFKLVNIVFSEVLNFIPWWKQQKKIECKTQENQSNKITLTISF